MRPQVAYVAGQPDENPDRAAALSALDRAGLDARPVSWDDPIDWGDADLVLVAQPQIGSDARRDFLRWAREVEELTRLANPAIALVRSSDRSYLRDAEGQGVPVVDTVWLEPGDTAQDCTEALAARDWTRFAVGAAAAGPDTWETAHDITAAARAAERIAAGGAVAMVQSHGVVTAPPLGVVVLGDRVSHGVRAGVPADVDEGLGRRALGWARTAMACENLLHARVDLVEQSGEWRLAGVDATAPRLHLDLASHAGDAYGHAVRQWVMPDAQAADYLAGSG